MLGRGVLNTRMRRSQHELVAAAGFQKSHSVAGFNSARVSPASFSFSFTVSVSRPVPARPPTDRFTTRLRHARSPDTGRLPRAQTRHRVWSSTTIKPHTVVPFRKHPAARITVPKTRKAFDVPRRHRPIIINANISYVSFLTRPTGPFPPGPA